MSGQQGWEVGDGFLERAARRIEGRSYGVLLDDGANSPTEDCANQDVGVENDTRLGGHASVVAVDRASPNFVTISPISCSSRWSKASRLRGGGPKSGGIRFPIGGGGDEVADRPTVPSDGDRHVSVDERGEVGTELAYADPLGSHCRLLPCITVYAS